MSTPTQKPAKPRKPSQTARILESVELLLALQEEQESSRGPSQEQTEKIADQLETLEQKLNQLSSTSNVQATQDDDGGPQNNDWTEKFEQLEFSIAGQLEKIADQCAAEPSSQTELSETRFDQLESSIVDKIEARLSAKLEKQFTEFEKSNKPAKDSSKDRNDKTAQQFAEANKKALKQQASMAEQLELISGTTGRDSDKRSRGC